MDIPAIQVVKSSDSSVDDGLLLSEACELYLRLKGVGKDKVFIRTANRNTQYVTNLSVGSTLWGLKRACESSQRKFLFSRYCSTDGNKSDHASNGLNKWLRPMVLQGCVVHSFRHSFRDHLRAVQCPSDVIDQIGGWKTAGLGQGYGEGYPLKVLAEWFSQIQEKT